MSTLLTTSEQMKELRSKKKEELRQAELRITKLEEAVFVHPPDTNRENKYDPITLIARVDRLEAAVKWWKK